MCLNFSSSVHEMKKPTRACVYPQVTQLCQRPEKKHAGSHSSQTMHRTHVLLDCAAGIITIHTYKYRTLCLGIMVVIIPLHVFFQCPNKLPNHNIHRDIKFKFLMLAYHVLPKKLPNSGRFPHWRQLCLAAQLASLGH